MSILNTKFHRFIAGRNQGTSYNDKLIKAIIINVFALIGIVFLTIFGLKNITNHNSIFGEILLAGAAITFGVVLYNWITGRTAQTVYFILSLMFIYEIFFIIDGGESNTAFLWYYVFPALSIFTIGLKRGLISVLILLVITLVLLFGNFQFMPHYGVDLKARFIASFIALTIMCAAFEYVLMLKSKELEKHRTNLELHVRDRTLELEYAKEKAVETDRLKSAFLANISHEIRTPMNAIVGFSDLLKSPGLDEESKNRMVQLIQSNSNDLLRLIEDILDVSKINTGQMEYNPSPQKICDLMEELEDEVKELLVKREKEHIKFNLVKNFVLSDVEIVTDMAKLSKVLRYLIDNAIKFTEDGEIVVGVDFDEQSDEQELLFYVKDTGIGLTPEEGEQIFNTFTTGAKSKNKLYGGTGLGLSICKNFVEMLGGNIWFKSEKGKGSVFFFTIKVDKSLVKEEEKSMYELSLEDINWTGKILLIAEDEELNFFYLNHLLQITNATILRAENGKQAIDLIQKQPVDLVLMDIVMPKIDGIEAANGIRKINKDIPIVAQTALSLESGYRDRILSVFDGYISKPIVKAQLISTLDKLLFPNKELKGVKIF